MGCPYHSDDVFDFVYGEGEAIQEKGFLDHLAQCPRHRRELAEFREIRDVMDRLPIAEPSERTVDAIMQMSRRSR